MKIEKSSQDLEAEVIFQGYCIHCGSCNSFCPHMDFNLKTGEAYVVDNCSETVGLCYNSCPRTYFPVSEIEKAFFGSTRVDLAVGVYKDIIQVKSKNNDEILYNLVAAAFEKGIVKHMVLGEPKQKNPPLALPIVVNNANDAKQYIPKLTLENAGPLVTGIGEAYLDKKRDIGILGNPCHIRGVAKIMVSDFNTGIERTSLRIANACSSGGMAGCRYCTDFSGEFSDISHSPWGAPDGEALLIIRTDIGQKVVDAAVEMGLIDITNRNPDLSEMKRFINKKRKKNFKTLLGKDLITAKYLKLNAEEIRELLED